MNRLSQQSSAYLKHAATQKIDWYPWSEEAFEKARQEDKPVFLSSGAVWCHWCHVMAEESFEDDEVAALLNERYVSIKVDRDEHPDIDRRYQQALTAMGVNGGWPLSVFLTPDKMPFYGGTYFPVGDSFDKPGFKTLLKAMSEFYKDRKDEVYEASLKFYEFLRQQSPRKGKFSEVLIDEEVKIILDGLDSKNGGFGTSPKFPMSGAIEFLIGRYFFKKDKMVEYAIKKTLIGMASGGLHDQLGGGFHRYSTDETWTIPHFEKMTEDNAWLLRNYIDAYSVFGEEFFKKVAENIIFFVRTELSRPDGGFYASMDADVITDDEGGYFTWTDEELRKTLPQDEYDVFALYFLNKNSVMHHDNTKIVLSLNMGIDDIARHLNMDIETASKRLEGARIRLLRKRQERRKPFTDNALYTSLNGMMASAFLKAYRVLRDERLKTAALASLDQIMRLNLDNGMLQHSPGVKAGLDDYVYLIDALVAAYEITAGNEYRNLAEQFMTTCIEKFWDNETDGFFDTEEEVVGLRLKNIGDTPRPSANAVAIIALLKLALNSQKEEYRQYAQKSLNAFSTEAQLMRVHGAYFFCALDAFYHMLKLDVQAPFDSALTQSVLFSYHPYQCIVYHYDEQNIVLPCVNDTCYEPLSSSEELGNFITSLRT